MKAFYYIPHTEIVKNPKVFENFVKLPGAEYTLEREGVIIYPNTTAHIRACLHGMQLLKGHWEDPEDV
jgi:hypothetical protein